MNETIMCQYMAKKFKERRKELGLSQKEVAAIINRSISIVSKSENSFSIGLHEMFRIGRDIYGFDMLALLDEAEAYSNQFEEVEK